MFIVSKNNFKHLFKGLFQCKLTKTTWEGFKFDLHSNFLWLCKLTWKLKVCTGYTKRWIQLLFLINSAKKCIDYPSYVQDPEKWREINGMLQTWRKHLERRRNFFDKSQRPTKIFYAHSFSLRFFCRFLKLTEFHHTRLLIKWKIFNVNLARAEK